MPAKTTAAPMRSPRQRLGADERRAQILTACTDVVAAKGYTKATLTEIAQGAGIAKGLLWHYFDDRNDLMQQTLRHLAREVREAVVTDLDLAVPVPQVIRAVLVRTAMLTRTHAIQLEAINQIVHGLHTPDGRQQVTMHDYDATYAEHERLLARGQTEGTIRQADPRVMAVSYQGVIDATIGYLQAHPDVDPHHHAAAVADLFLAGVTQG